MNFDISLSDYIISIDHFVFMSLQSSIMRMKKKKCDKNNVIYILTMSAL